MKLFFLLSLSVVMIFLDLRQQYLQQFRSVLSLVVSPIHYFVDIPIQLVGWLETSFTGYRNLIEARSALQAENVLLRANLQNLVSLEKENLELRALLKSSARLQGKLTAAQLLAVDSDPFIQQIVLNKGSRDSVYVGQPVLDATGVVGQIIRVGPVTSHVLLLTDSRSAIPVENTRNATRGIVTGTGDPDTLELAHVSKTTDVQVGDLLVTSGLGQNFPMGYPVGVVTQVSRHSSNNFAKVLVRPNARLNQSHLLLLIWPVVPIAPSSTPIKAAS